MDRSKLRCASYIRFRLHRTLRQSMLLRLLGLLGAHRLLDYIVHFVLVALMKDRGILSRGSLPMMVMMS